MPDAPPPVPDQEFLDRMAEKLVHSLRAANHRIVLAESCTAGLIAATLSRIPGVSDVLVGSAVVYQTETKVAWLGIDRTFVSDKGPVSREVAEAMAVCVLEKTSHATISLSMTGHLGPDAPPELDGVAWCAVSVRGQSTLTRRLTLAPGHTPESSRGRLRSIRQTDALQQAMQWVEQVLTFADGPPESHSSGFAH